MLKNSCIYLCPVDGGSYIQPLVVGFIPHELLQLRKTGDFNWGLISPPSLMAYVIFGGSRDIG